jgi:hypothetical protein
MKKKGYFISMPQGEQVTKTGTHEISCRVYICPCVALSERVFAALRVGGPLRAESMTVYPDNKIHFGQD